MLAAGRRPVMDPGAASLSIGALRNNDDIAGDLTFHLMAQQERFHTIFDHSVAWNRISILKPGCGARLTKGLTGMRFDRNSHGWCSEKTCHQSRKNEVLKPHPFPHLLNRKVAKRVCFEFKLIVR